MLSVAVLTQRVAQYVCPVGQAQVPETHDWPVGQARPHIPQLLRSVATLTQRPPQTVWPAGHAQTPAMQVCPLAQTLPHEPQLLASLEETQRPEQ